MQYSKSKHQINFDKVYLIARAVKVPGEENYISKLIELKKTNTKSRASNTK